MCDIMEKIQFGNQEFDIIDIAAKAYKKRTSRSISARTRPISRLVHMAYYAVNGESSDEFRIEL